MSEIVEKFKLKRTLYNNLTAFTGGKLYTVYHNDTDRNTNLAFYIIDDYGFQQFFNTIDGQVDTRLGHLKTEYWEVIRTSKEEKTMTKDFTGLKVGDKLTRDNDDWSWWIKGKEYEVKHNDTGRYPECDFYIMDDEGDRRWFNVEYGKITNNNVNTYFSWNKPEETTPIMKDGMTLVCTRENKDYAMFTEGTEYPVCTDYDEPCIFSDGNTAWFEREINVLKGYGVEFTVKEVEVESEETLHSITITGHNWVDLENNLREAYRTVKNLNQASDNFDQSTAELAKRVLAFKKIGGQ